ncbi:MAG: DUF6390 family protein [Candidatus Limnocylindrales bacterium]
MIAVERALPSPPPAVPLDGPTLFARYAFGPNRLGLCGPDEWPSLLELGAGQDARAGAAAELRRLAAGFEGAWPYLQLIARSAGVTDPLDRRVVEAYWLGTRDLPVADARSFAVSLEDRFHDRTSRREWPWLAAKPTDGALPVHAFHVLDVLPRVGLIRGGQVDDVLRVMDSCRIRWGRVVDTLDDRLLVEAVPLEMMGGRLRLAAPRLETIRRSLDGRAFVGDLVPGETISIHWDWACDRLDHRRLSALIASTRRQLAITNRTI